MWLDLFPCLKPLSRSLSRSSSITEFQVKPDTDEIIPKKKEVKVAGKTAKEEEEEEVDGQSVDPEDIEDTLIQLIEEIGGDKIIKELEQIISGSNGDDDGDKGDDEQQEEEDVPDAILKKGARTVVDLHSSVHPCVPNGILTARIANPIYNEVYRQVDSSPPDSGLQIHSSTDAISRKPLRRQFEVSERTSDFVRDARRFNNMDNASDCASLSEFDGHHPNGHHEPHGVTGSSTSLVDPYADGKRQGWGIIRDRYLPQKDWRGSSVPTSLHRDPWSKVLTPMMAKKTTAVKYISSEPQRRLWQERNVPKSMYRGSVTNLVPQQGFRDDLEGNGLRRTYSVGMMHNLQSAGNNFSCISESDADTMETVV